MRQRQIPPEVLRLRQQLVAAARKELDRRHEEVDPAVVEAARNELMKIYDEMAARLGIS